MAKTDLECSVNTRTVHLDHARVPEIIENDVHACHTSISSKHTTHQAEMTDAVAAARTEEMVTVLRAVQLQARLLPRLLRPLLQKRWLRHEQCICHHCMHRVEHVCNILPLFGREAAELFE